METKIIHTLLIILLFAACVEGLRCYSCFATGPNNECEKYGTYEEAMNGDNEELKKNCTTPHDQVCTREVFIDRGNTISHIRDCNDGLSFSFNSSVMNDKGAYSRLFEMNNNNETSCVFDGLHMVCLSKCSEDFCNGPQLEEKINGSDVTRIPLILLVFVQLVVLLI